MSLRHAKDMFESTAKMERELKHLFNGTCKYYCALSILQRVSNGRIFIIAVFTCSVVFCDQNKSDMNGSISLFSRSLTQSFRPVMREDCVTNAKSVFAKLGHFEAYASILTLKENEAVSSHLDRASLVTKKLLYGKTYDFLAEQWVKIAISSPLG